jgi:polysaccharide deacetylase 2 family uncharacterized protein YibQ
LSHRRRRPSAATVFFALLSLALGIALYLKSRPSPPPAPPVPVPVTPSPRPLVAPSPRRPPAPSPRPSIAPSATTEPRIAILIDDLGNDRAALERLAAWAEPVAGAVLPQLTGSAAAAEELARSGKEVLLHLPMEPRGFPGVRPGPGVVLVSQSDAEIRRTIADDLASVPRAAGVNNHMGSLATADRRVMGVVASELARRRLFFVDSRTTDATVAAEAAAAVGVPCVSRRVFLDDIQTEVAVTRSLEQLVAKARAEGFALAIGHPHPATLAVLERELPHVGRRGVRLVPVSELAR